MAVVCGRRRAQDSISRSVLKGLGRPHLNTARIQHVCVLHGTIRCVGSDMIGRLVSPPNSYVEIPTPSVTVLGGGVFRSCLGHDVGALKKGSSALIKRDPRELPLSSSMWDAERK